MGDDEMVPRWTRADEEALARRVFETPGNAAVLEALAGVSATGVGTIVRDSAGVYDPAVRILTAILGALARYDGALDQYDRQSPEFMAGYREAARIARLAGEGRL